MNLQNIVISPPDRKLFNCVPTTQCDKYITYFQIGKSRNRLEDSFKKYALVGYYRKQKRAQLVLGSF